MAHCNLASHRGRDNKREVGPDIGQINNLMETGLDGQKAVRPGGFHQQAINFTISDLHSAGQRVRGEILRGPNAGTGE